MQENSGVLLEPSCPLVLQGLPGCLQQERLQQGGAELEWVTGPDGHGQLRSCQAVEG